MKMKKLLALLLALIMVFALAACGNDDANTDDDDDDEGKKESTSATTAPAGDPTDPPIVTPTDPPIVMPTDPPIVTPTDPPIVTPTDPPIVTPTEPSDTRPTGTPVSPLEQQIVGSWTATVSVDAAAMGQEGMVGNLELTMTITLNADGTSRTHMHKEAYMESIKNMIVENLYAQLGSEAAAEEYCQATLNMSCQEYASMFVDSMAGALDIEDYTGPWSLDGNQLTMGDSVMTITLDGDTMTWVSSDMMESFGTDTIVLHRA